MNILNVLPVFSALISFIFAGFVLRRFFFRHSSHLLLWTVGMVFYGIGGFCEAYNGLVGWSPLIFRLWYLFGAILVAAWLGQGTVYLLARRRLAQITLAILILASLYAAVRVFTAQLDPSLMVSSLHTGSELSGQAIITPGVRTLTPFFNIYGTLTLVGGAIYSAWIFWRKQVLPHRALGNVLIAVGALLPAFGGGFSRLGIPGALYILELLGAILMFLGFLRATTPFKKPTGPTLEKSGS